MNTIEYLPDYALLAILSKPCVILRFIHVHVIDFHCQSLRKNKIKRFPNWISIVYCRKATGVSLN